MWHSHLLTMPSRLYKKTSTGLFSKSLTHESVNVVWYHSSRKNGKLVLQANQFARQNERMIAFRPLNSGSGSWAYTPGSVPLNPTQLLTRCMAGLEAQSYASLRARLYKGSASLGVTIASWKQSRNMIVDRYRQMSLQSDSFEQRARQLIETRYTGPRERVRRLRLDRLGGQYLEMVFGWKPLLSDIHAAVTTVVSTQPKAQRLAARAREYADLEVVRGDAAVEVKHYIQGIVRCTRAVSVEVSNPNKWLQERAGLNNPAAVAWDLVPWSFVVNMFVNTGSLVNSITDFAGLTFTNVSTTRAYDLTVSTRVKQKVNYPVPIGGYSSFQYDNKRTVLEGVTRPPLVFKMPEVNWELAAIAGSLFFQKFRSLDNLMAFTQRR